MLGFFVIVAVVGFVAKWGAVNNARFGQALACLAGAPTLFMAYHKRYPVKKSLKSLAEGSNLYKEGVKDLWRTIVDLGKTNPAAQRYLFTIMFTDAAIGGFTNLGETTICSCIIYHCHNLKSAISNHLPARTTTIEHPNG